VVQQASRTSAQMRVNRTLTALVAASLVGSAHQQYYSCTSDNQITSASTRAATTADATATAKNASTAAAGPTAAATATATPAASPATPTASAMIHLRAHLDSIPLAVARTEVQITLAVPAKPGSFSRSMEPRGVTTALLLSQVSSFSVGVGGAHARYKANPLREPAPHTPAFSQAEKATRSTQCVHLTLHDGSTANAARPLQLPAPAD
jgi:hypothetical protein